MRILKISLFSLVLIICAFSVNAAFEMQGAIKYANGTAVNNANVSVKVVLMPAGSGPITNQTITNLTNSTGNFIIANISDANALFMYKLTIKKYASNNKTITHVGPMLPEFGKVEFATLNNSNTYLKTAATINLTVMNRTNGSQLVSFYYMVKDTTLGFPIEEEWDTRVYNATLALPDDRNYSIMVMPDESPPVNHDLNYIKNGSFNSPYYINVSINTSSEFVRVTGNLVLENGSNISTVGFNKTMDIKVYQMETGDMISDHKMESNMGLWQPTTQATYGADEINITNARYDIALPATVSGLKYLVLAFITNGTKGAAETLYYMGLQNFTALYGGGNKSINLTLRPSAGAYESTSNINASLTKFWLVSATNSSSYVASAFTDIKTTYYNLSDGENLTVQWMLTSNDTGMVTVPLWNTSAIDRLQIFSQQYAPRKLKYTASDIRNNATINISMSTMDTKDSDGNAIDVNLKMYFSNSSCDVPYPTDDSCLITSSTKDNFKPIVGLLAGKVSFRMTSSTGGVIIHYVNVDMLASGPPDSELDTLATDTGGTGFDKIQKFGSLGPDIYDHLLIGIPYSDSNLLDSNDVNMSIPYLYDNNWNLIWNTSVNGTNVTGNLSDYADYNNSFFTGVINCSRTVISSSANMPDCYINTSANMIWVKVPHFSGGGYNAKGTSAPSSSPSGGGSGGGSSISKCTPRWLCTAWSKCTTEEKQTRKCVDKNQCDTTPDKPAEKQTCVYEEPIEEVQEGVKEETTQTDSTTEEEVEEAAEGEIKEKPKRNAALTIALLAAITLIIGVSIYFINIKKK